MRLKAWMTTPFLISFLAGCPGPTLYQGALVKDVIPEPPVSERTVRYLVRNDRPMAEYVAYMVRICEEHGCKHL